VVVALLPWSAAIIGQRGDRLVGGTVVASAVPAALSVAIASVGVVDVRIAWLP
jgi:hypothetical protein